MCDPAQPIPKSARGVRGGGVFQCAQVGTLPAERQALTRGGHNGVQRSEHDEV